MKRRVVLACVLLLILAGIAGFGPRAGQSAFSPYVDPEGRISLPREVRRHWVHLGSYVASEAGAPGKGFIVFSALTLAHEQQRGFGEGPLQMGITREPITLAGALLRAFLPTGRKLCTLGKRPISCTS